MGERFEGNFVVNIEYGILVVHQEADVELGDPEALDDQTSSLLRDRGATHLSAWFNPLDPDSTGHALNLTVMREGHDLHVDVEIHPDRPDDLGAGWTDIVELPFPALRRVQLGDVFNPTSEPDEAIPLEFGRPYRLRYAIDDADAAEMTDDGAQQERYLLQFWIAPLEPSLVVRTNSERGRSSAERFATARAGRTSAPDTGIDVRAARTEDLEGIAQVLDRPASELRSTIEQWTARDAIRIAERRSTIVGVAMSEPSFFGNEFIELVRVAPSARRLGVASRLIESVSRDRRSSKLFTSTNLSNTSMQTLLGSLGWTSAGIVYGLDDDDPELFYRAPDLS